MPDEQGDDGSNLANKLLRRRATTDTVDAPANPLEVITDDLFNAVDDIERRAGDEQLRSHLAAMEFRGPVYDDFVRELAAYGIGVCLAKVRSGAMFRDCMALDRPCEPPPADFTEQDMRSLVNETVSRALVAFREQALVGGKWKPDGRASLTTYFIGTCVLCFANVYRSWLAERRRWDKVAAFLAHERPHNGPTDPAEIVTNRDHIRQQLSHLDARTGEVLVLSTLGYQQAEIAEIMSISARAVEGILHRHRRRLNTPDPTDGGPQ